MEYRIELSFFLKIMVLYFLILVEHGLGAMPNAAQRSLFPHSEDHIQCKAFELE